MPALRVAGTVIAAACNPAGGESSVTATSSVKSGCRVTLTSNVALDPCGIPIASDSSATAYGGDVEPLPPAPPPPPPPLPPPHDASTHVQSTANRILMVASTARCRRSRAATVATQALRNGYGSAESSGDVPRFQGKVRRRRGH